MFNPRIEVFSTCPPSSGFEPGAYLKEVVRVARWSEGAGCRGILVYSDNSLVDPWLVSQVIIESTRSLCPLVAVQPIYMHPYTVAKMVATFGHLYGRQIYLNMVAGGFKNDLEALNDETPHDSRYHRLIEYTTIVQRLLSSPAPFTFAGEFCRVDKLRLTPPLPPALYPGIFVSGSSQAGMAAARVLGATAIEYPKPAQERGDAPPPHDVSHGIRVGIIARAQETDAWDLARARFPEDRKGQLTRQLATKVSDSVWHKQLSRLPGNGGENPYWMVPFQNYKTMCPYLVGSYDGVSAELERYTALGYRSFILDVPQEPDELHHASLAFDRALDRCLNHSQTG
jgi:alkanesulfonate monooxygenase